MWNEATSSKIFDLRLALHSIRFGVTFQTWHLTDRQIFGVFASAYRFQHAVAQSVWLTPKIIGKTSAASVTYPWSNLFSRRVKHGGNHKLQRITEPVMRVVPY